MLQNKTGIIRHQSALFQQRISQLIPGGVNSPVRNCAEVLDTPLIVERGEGDTIHDIDGNQYIDLCCSWGALIHGHAHPTILQRIQQQAVLGTSYGITCPAEEVLARRLIDLVPSIEKVRCVSSGTEATMTAARLARGYTGRDLIVKFSGNYHGHADFFLVQAGSGVMHLSSSSSSAGIPRAVVENTLSIAYNDIAQFEQVVRDPSYRHRIAAVIVEPIAGNMGVVPPKPGFLESLRELTREIGALLIFDEVITGFRVALGGAQQLYGIDPDLTCLGKIMAGGLPAAAVGGKREIMDCLAPLGNVYQAGTLSGNPLAMAAGDQALKMLQLPGVYLELERKTNIITKPVASLIADRGLAACIQQVGSMFTLFFGATQVENRDDALRLDKEAYKRFFVHLFNHGIYIPPCQMEACFVSMVHQESHLEKTRDLFLDYLSSRM